MAEFYDQIGIGYRDYRAPDPRIQALINEALGDARSVLNVGAGAGSYEPIDRPALAVEPSAVMIAQRKPALNPVVRAHAGALPFPDDSFDAALALLTVHHWPDRSAGLEEMRRVARRSVIVFTHDGFHDNFWLMDYFPEILEVDDRIMPTVEEFESVYASVREVRVPVPGDCCDGFLAAYWRRPEAYLDPGVRSAISAFAMIDNVETGLTKLRDDLASGAWLSRHRELMECDRLDLGYKLAIASPD